MDAAGDPRIAFNCPSFARPINEEVERDEARMIFTLHKGCDPFLDRGKFDALKSYSHAAGHDGPLIDDIDQDLTSLSNGKGAILFALELDLHDRRLR